MKQILLVDDSEHDRVLYRRYLNKYNDYERLEIHEALTGEEGLRLFASLRPDCVLLDYNLPDTDGLSLLRELQQLARPDPVCVVMITGGGSEKLAVQALNNGALDYIVKQQFDPELLNKTVWHAIEKNEWRQYEGRYHTQLKLVNQQLRDSLDELTATRQQIQEKNLQLIATNQQLARTNTDLDNFVYAASHDLRQPVNNLRGLFDELRRSAVLEDAEQEYMWRLVDSSLQALTTTITDLAAVVQEERLPGAQTTETVHLPELVTDVLQALHPQVMATQAVLSTDFAALPDVQYARSNLRTIVLNLVSNALKYRHPARPPHVRVRSYKMADQAVLEIEDNGMGLNLERHGAELFQLFRRFHPQADEGTGVGLFLVNRLVQMHGGRIEVESQPEQGTTFRVFL